ncbi:MAG: hypothetical protein ACI90V_005174 [Bacillariaceae sp.]|jgi:hypothetical protein
MFDRQILFLKRSVLTTRDNRIVSIIHTINYTKTKYILKTTPIKILSCVRICVV